MKQPSIINHLIYGDIDEMPLDVLGDECPNSVDFGKMDMEQIIRLQSAATVLSWLRGELHKCGYKFNKKQHKEKDRLK